MRHPRNALWSRYVDHDVPKDVTRRLEVHLAHCSRCRQVVEAFGRLGDAARAAESPVWSAKAFRADFERRANSRRTHAYRPGWLKPAAASLGFALLISAGLWTIRWNYRSELKRQTTGLVAEHRAARLGELAVALGEGRQ